MSDTFSHEFKWVTPGASNVVVTGTFDNWRASGQLFKQADGSFTGNFQLPYHEKVLYKYVVDGNWVTGPDQPTEDDGKGNVNNVLEAKDPSVGGAEASNETTGRGSIEVVTNTIGTFAASAAGAAGALFAAVTGSEPRYEADHDPAPGVVRTTSDPDVHPASDDIKPNSNSVVEQAKAGAAAATQTIASTAQAAATTVVTALQGGAAATEDAQGAPVNRTQAGSEDVLRAKDADLAQPAPPQEASAGAGAASMTTAPPAPEAATTDSKAPAADAAPATLEPPAEEKKFASADDVVADQEPSKPNPSLALASTQEAPLSLGAFNPSKVAEEAEAAPKAAAATNEPAVAPAGISPTSEAAKTADASLTTTANGATAESNGVHDEAKPFPAGKGAPPVTPSKDAASTHRKSSRFSTFGKSSKAPVVDADDGAESGANGNGSAERKRKGSFFGLLKAKMSPAKGKKEGSSH